MNEFTYIIPVYTTGRALKGIFTIDSFKVAILPKL